MDHSFLAAADDLDKVLDDFEKNEEVSPDFRVASTTHPVIKKSPQTTPQKNHTHTMNGDASIHHADPATSDPHGIYPTTSHLQGSYPETSLPSHLQGSYPETSLPIHLQGSYVPNTNNQQPSTQPPNVNSAPYVNNQQPSTQPPNVNSAPYVNNQQRSTQPPNLNNAPYVNNQPPSTPPPNLNNAPYRDKSDTVASTDSNFELDLDEADFAPSPQTLPPNLTSLSFLQNQGERSMPLLQNQGEQTTESNLQQFPSLRSDQSLPTSNTLPEYNQSTPTHNSQDQVDITKSRNDSNMQLNAQDFSSYLPTNANKTLSFGDLQSMQTGSSVLKEINHGSSLVGDYTATTVPDLGLSHPGVSQTSATHSQSTEEVRHTETSGSGDLQGSPQRILQSQRSSNDQAPLSPQRTLQQQPSYTAHLTSDGIHLVESVDSTTHAPTSPTRSPASPIRSPASPMISSPVPVPDRSLKPNFHRVTTAVDSIHGSSQVPSTNVDIVQDNSGTPVSRPSAPPSELINSAAVDRTSNSLDLVTENDVKYEVVVSESLPQDAAPVTNSSEERSDATHVINQQVNGESAHLSQTVELNSEDSLSSASSSVSSTLPDPKLMDEYVRQGARPKTIIPSQSPKHSPLKTNSAEEESSAPSSPSKVSPPKIIQPQVVPSQGSPTKPVIGFQSIDNITVTDADLDALEEDNDVNTPSQSGVPQGSTVGPDQSVAPQGLNSTGKLTVVQNMDDGDSPRVSPISKLLDRQFQPVSASEGESNEFASMDPFYNTGSEEIGTQGIQDQSRPNLPVRTSPKRGVVPQGSIQGPMQSSISSGVPPPGTGTNTAFTMSGDGNTQNLSSIPKQSINANVDSQINNSNSQPLPSDDVGVKDHGVKDQQVDSLLDISNTALQGLSLALNATPAGDADLSNSTNSQQPEIQPNSTTMPNSHSSPQHQRIEPPSHLNMQSNTPQQQTLVQPQPQEQNSMPPALMTMPAAPMQNGDVSNSPSRAQRTANPAAFQLPPPEDPPSYQEVEEATHREASRGQGPQRPGVSRQSLSLNFEHPPLRRTTASPIPPSPIIEDATPETVVPPEGAQNSHTGLVNSESVPSQIPDQQNGLVSQTGLLLPGDQQNADVDSRTSSIETDSDHEADFPPGLVPELSQELIQLGNVAPVWLPDSEATSCMMCTSKFTFRKRRHHCRACGKIFCSKCCSTRIKLKYMDSKEARVCVSCLNTILRAQALQRQARPPNAPDPRNPAEYCSTVPPTQQASQMATQNPDATAAAPPSVMVPVNKSSLRRPSEGSQRSKETRHVRFSDGIHPGVDQGDLPSKSATNSHHKTNLKRHHAPPLPPTKEEAEVQGGDSRIGLQGGDSRIGLQGGSRRKLLNQAGSHSLIPNTEGALPPIVCTTECKGEFMVEENPDVEQLLADLRSEDNTNPVVFVLNKNLLVMVKIVNLNCCVNRTCWCFATKGMATAGQDEIVLVLECLPDEKMVPKDIFTHLQTVYEEASKGNTVSHMSHTICSQPGFLGSRDHGGFLYLQPTFQCLRQLVLPESPYLFAVLLQKWETPWAKVFPLRLLLRLGAEFRYYPCPLMSVRFRKPVFGEIGHTIMNLLADFKNYQYLLPVIPGVTILMKDRETNINFPKNRYDEIMKVLNNSNEHVMALAANFSSDADSHLVCIQNDDGSYQTQAINIQNKLRKVTGASFVVFNGALKSSSGLTAKSSIVEDGLMVQIRPEMMTSLRQAIREMQNFVIPCKSVTGETVEETVCIKWVDDDQKFNLGVNSPIDNRSMEGIESVRIHNGTDFRGQSRSLRWTEVFFLENSKPVGHNHREPVDLSKLAESLSVAFSIALSSHLDELRELGLARLGLRVTIDTEKVGYEAGSKGQQLPPVYMNELDNELIPVLHNAVSQHEGGTGCT